MELYYLITFISQAVLDKIPSSFPNTRARQRLWWQDYNKSTFEIDEPLFKRTTTSKHNSIYLMALSIDTECLINRLTQKPPWAFCEITGDMESIFENKAIDFSVSQTWLWEGRPILDPRVGEDVNPTVILGQPSHSPKGYFVLFLF